MKVNLVSLGCAKNLVDSERMLGALAESGLQIMESPSDADVIIINTCSFIESAVNESIDQILELAEYKKNGGCKRLIVTGCLPQRYGAEISEALPEVDMFLGTAAFDRIIEAAAGDPKTPRCIIPSVDHIRRYKTVPARINTAFPVAYLKIAEGCNRRCSYCIIPKLRGKQKSTPVELLVDESRRLIESGARELVLVAQETTNYGVDLADGTDLVVLLDRLSDFFPDARIRILYAHPESMTDSVIQMIAGKKNIVPYFDIPIQHSETKLLKQMARGYDKDSLYRLFETIRSKIPDAALRTTVMVGFPGETGRDFRSLVKFIEDVRFNHLGGFTYSDAKEQPSHRLSGKVAAETAEKRLDELMGVQMGISFEHNRRHKGRIFEVIVDRQVETGLYEGRTVFQAPDVDGATYVRSKTLTPGALVHVKIEDVFEYDLYGDPV